MVAQSELVHAKSVENCISGSNFKWSVGRWEGQLNPLPIISPPQNPFFPRSIFLLLEVWIITILKAFFTVGGKVMSL